MTPRLAVLLAVVAGFALSCGGDDESSSASVAPRVGAPGTLSVAALRTHVQPMFDQNCAQTACHGDPARPFFLYSKYATRIGSRFTSSLTDEELQANLESAKKLVDGAADVTDSQLLTRPLRTEAGGTSHGGGDQFYDRADPSYVLLTCWLLGGTYDGSECVSP